MKVRKIPQRLCVGCQEMKNKKELIRIVKTPENEILIDTTGKKSGRGAYICANRDCLEKAVKEKRLERSLKQAISPEIFAALREGLNGHE